MQQYRTPFDRIDNVTDIGPTWQFIANDTIRPIQYFGSGKPRIPEENLLVAILEDALNCWMRTHWTRSHQAQRMIDAHYWIFKDAPALFTFQYVCDGLGLDSDYIRSGLKKWQHKQGLTDPDTSTEHAWRSRHGMKTGLGRRAPVKRHVSVGA